MIVFVLSLAPLFVRRSQDGRRGGGGEDRVPRDHGGDPDGGILGDDSATGVHDGGMAASADAPAA
jgi:hypothetical protein